ncbi:MAG: 50S ribosomal protein L11 methyltransferase [Bacteroidetes bacterium]|nr:50S ribosomal protein L11 methyltransferase [Bacteroidota bacterium]MDA0943942.1 50S ribosomal protein L11 methyltransferase [Bacteroidota bacterium]MDA1112186.1 50S ribosomal protein L11 methyltransferase [Bacteroidota bacterium]
MAAEYLCFSIWPLSEEGHDFLPSLLEELPFDTFETNDEGVLVAYGPSADFSQELQKLAEEIIVDFASKWTWHTRDKENWNELWEKNFFQPLSVGRLHIRAPFHEPAPEGSLEIIIEPRMSFGTGHHGTTQLLCGALLERESMLKGAKILDMGSGTGILAIVAEKLGAAEVLGIEIDDWVVDNARDNVRLNGCGRTQMQHGTAEALPAIEEGYYDQVLANIHREVLLADMPAYQRVLKPGGLLYLSGLNEPDLPLIAARAEGLGLVEEFRGSMGAWWALVYVNPSA